jgi:ribosome biogenesis GTPase / thiamine phosphate phosphatase
MLKWQTGGSLRSDAADELEGVVRRVTPGRVFIDIQGEAVGASVRGGLKEGARETVNLVAVGDRVRLRPSDGRGVLLEKVLPRRNELARVDPGDSRGQRKHVLAANLDRICVVVSLDQPRFNPRGVDRFLVLAAVAEIPVLIVLNKCDLHRGSAGSAPFPGEILALYRSLGYEAIGTSVATEQGIEALRCALVGGLSFLLGPSGAGKSSLLNALYGLDLRTAAISRSSSKGVHTTTRVDWIDLPGGGAVLDSPGLRSIQPWGLDRASLASCFPEFGRAESCRFGNCLHRGGEAGCAVEAAVADGLVPSQRLESYRRILATLD